MYHKYQACSWASHSGSTTSECARNPSGKLSLILSNGSGLIGMQTTYIGEISNSVSFPVIKVSILLLHHPLFPGQEMTPATNIISAFVILRGLAILLVSIFPANLLVDSGT